MPDQDNQESIANSPETTQIEPQTQNSTEATPEAVSAPVSPNYDYLDQSPEELDRQRTQLALVNGNKKLLIRERTAKLMDTWWNNLEVMLYSDDPKERLWAMGEFNKVQIKQIPTTLANDEDNPITPALNKDERNRITDTITAIIGFAGQS